MSRPEKERAILLLREKERRRCATDPQRFIERYLTIEDRAGAPIPFTLWPFQHEALESFDRDGQVVVLKARQLGLSWLALAYALWLALFQQGSRILILNKKDTDAKILLARIRRMVERIEQDPTTAFLLSGLPKGREAAEQLEVGRSVIRSVVGKADSVRGETAVLVILDEFAFATDAPDIWRAVVPMTQKLICISTGNGAALAGGQGAEFAEQYERADSGASGFRSLFFPWHVHPERDEAWKSKRLAMMGDDIERFKVEYPESVGDAFLSPDADLIYDLGALNAAEKLGAEFDALREAGELTPLDGMQKIAIDWGNLTTHCLVVWPLGRGGFYIPPGELEVHGGETRDISSEIYRRTLEYEHGLDEVLYDHGGSGAQSIHSTKAVMQGQPIGYYGVAFNTDREPSINYLRLLLRRTLEGKRDRVLAISPHNRVLLTQLRQLARKPNGDIDKDSAGGAHAADALICAVARTAKRHHDITEA